MRHDTRIHVALLHRCRRAHVTRYARQLPLMPRDAMRNKLIWLAILPLSGTTACAAAMRCRVAAGAFFAHAST